MAFSLHFESILFNREIKLWNIKIPTLSLTSRWLQSSWISYTATWTYPSARTKSQMKSKEDRSTIHFLWLSFKLSIFPVSGQWSGTREPRWSSWQSLINHLGVARSFRPESKSNEFEQNCSPIGLVDIVISFSFLRTNEHIELFRLAMR